MNIDLIIKLCRLANNNPNENEANLAARKVCKLLAEADFKFANTATEPRPQATRQNPVYETSDIYEWMRRYAEKHYKETARSGTWGYYNGKLRYTATEANEMRYETKKATCKSCNKSVDVWEKRTITEDFECATCAGQKV